jgi:hypothetical protein
MPTERAAAFLERFRRWAERRPDLIGALLVGSQARDDHAADPWSDVDLVLIADDPAPYLADGSWLSELGTPVATFVEPTMAGQTERRVLFDDGLDVDLPVLSLGAAESFLREQAGPIGTVLRRGVRVLLDRDGWLTERVGRIAATPLPDALPDQAALDQVVNDFWYTCSGRRGSSAEMSSGSPPSAATATSSGCSWPYWAGMPAPHPTWTPGMAPGSSRSGSIPRCRLACQRPSPAMTPSGYQGPSGPRPSSSATSRARSPRNLVWSMRRLSIKGSRR